MMDMLAVADASVDAVFFSHNIEHLHPHEAPPELKEFLWDLAKVHFPG